jgi:hypothetical protein
MQNVTVIQAYAYSDVIKRVVELTKQGYEVDYSARVYPRFVGNKYVVTMGIPVEEVAVEPVVVDSAPQEVEPEKKPTRAKKKVVDGDDGVGLV